MSNFSSRSFVAADNAPVQAALAVLETLPASDPVPAVSMNADGRLLIIGEAAVASGWAERLAAQRQVTVFSLTPDKAAVDALIEPDFLLEFGSAPTLSGHLGAFELRWKTPQGDRQATFDAVLDLSPDALLKRVELPTGYVAPGRDALDQALAVIDLLAFDGEFEKPRYVAVNERLCAHSRSQKAGCSNCIEVCATAAIVSAGDKVALDPYLCQGCGTCTTVCPSGALSFQYPRVADLGVLLKTQLQAYRTEGGQTPCVLFYSAESGRRMLQTLQRAGQGLPARVVPLEIWSSDAVGLDLLLGTLTMGAAQVAVLGAGSHDLAPSRTQAGYAQAILNGLGYAGEFVRMIDGDQPDWLAGLADWALPASITPAEFRLLADKRTTLEFVVDHLIKHAPQATEAVALPLGAPFGRVEVSAACTLCMSCTSACPASALKAAADAPRLSFIERNCLQCGLCANTCPENAITLTPRLLTQNRRADRVVAEAEVFCCTACGKPMGAAPAIQQMIAKLTGHSMFASPEALARLSMCGDCRVIDLVHNEKSTKAWEMTE